MSDDPLKDIREASDKYFAAVDAAAIADPLPEETIESLLSGIEDAARLKDKCAFEDIAALATSLRAKLNELSTAELQIEKLKRNKRQAQVYRLLTEGRFGGVGPTMRLLALALVRNAVALAYATNPDIGPRKLVGDAIAEIAAIEERKAIERGALLERLDYGVGLASIALMLFAERSGISVHDAERASADKLHVEIAESRSGRNDRKRPTHLADRWPVPV